MLRPGDTVGVVATGFAVQRAPLESGLRAIERMGFGVLVSEGTRRRDGYFAGNDEARAGELNAMLAAPDVKAIWFARGGYGTARILDRIDWKALGRQRKTLIGYSDLTALFCAAAGRANLRCLYGPVVSEMGDRRAFHGPSLRGLLAGKQIEMPVSPRKVLVPGRAAGPLVGGNLNVLASLWGTPHEPDLRGRILLIEEVGEEAYRVDRMLTQLRQSGALAGVRGVLLGALDVPARRRFPPDRVLGEILGENFLPLGVPVIVDLPLGHRRAKWTVPVGGVADVDTTGCRVRFAP